MARPKVYIPNRSYHDFSRARRFGDLVFLTEGMVNKYKVNQLYRQVVEAMEDASPRDYLLVSSLTIINAVASSVLAHKFGRVNFLLFSHGQYVVREIVLDDLEDGAGQAGAVNF